MRDDSSIDPAGTQPQYQESQAPQAFQPPPATPQRTIDPAPQATQQPATQQTAADRQTATQQSAAAEASPATQQTAGAQEPATRGQGTLDNGIRDLSIWDTGKADEFRHRWHEVQTHFVEDPRGSVTEARQLVDEAVQSLSESVHEREEELERAGARSSDSTEGMRDTVLQYHVLLDRVLSV